MFPTAFQKYESCRSVGVVLEPDEVRRRVEQVPVGERDPAPCSRAGTARRRRRSGRTARRRGRARRLASSRCSRWRIAPRSSGRARCRSPRSPFLPRSCVHLRIDARAGAGARAVGSARPERRRRQTASDVLDVLEELLPGDFAVCFSARSAAGGAGGGLDVTLMRAQDLRLQPQRRLAKILPTGALLKNGFLKFCTAGSSAGPAGSAGCPSA